MGFPGVRALGAGFGRAWSVNGQWDDTRFFGGGVGQVGGVLDPARVVVPASGGCLPSRHRRAMSHWLGVLTAVVRDSGAKAVDQEVARCRD